MGSTIGLQADTFREQLITFLDGVQEGAMAPTGTYVLECGMVIRMVRLKGSEA